MESPTLTHTTTFKILETNGSIIFFSQLTATMKIFLLFSMILLGMCSCQMIKVLKFNPKSINYYDENDIVTVNLESKEDYSSGIGGILVKEIYSQKGYASLLILCKYYYICFRLVLESLSIEFRL